MAEPNAEVLVLRPEVVGTVVEDGAVLLHLDRNDFYEVNHPGWAIVQLFEAGARRDDVLARCREWGAAPDDAAVVKFLDVLLTDGLVVPSEWPAGTAEVTLAVAWSAPTIDKAPEALQRIVRSPFDPTLPLAE
ncbi:MAG: PqqD family protein [Deltaproteobacteria bacterium]|nr:PqqD family protein [Deltaproteobacteria bacterium]